MLGACAVLLVACGALAPHGDPAKALAAWRKLYVGGEIELGGIARSGSRSAALYGELLADRRSELTHFEALDALFDVALDRQEPHVVRELVRLAAIEADPSRRPDVVRAAAVSALGQLTETDAIWVLLRTASGSSEGWPRWHESLHAAALRALGSTALPVARPTIEKQLAAEHAEVRLAAAEALAAVGRPRTLDAICRALPEESDWRVAAQLATSARVVVQNHRGACDVARVRRLLFAARDALGKTDWHADLAVVELFAVVRAEAAVEPLLRILERFHDSPEDIDRGKLSGLLRNRAHEVLESLTGARIPSSEPERWRAFWEQVRDGFVLAAEPPRATAATTSGFFGIPIVGTRVVFVIDRSGSMSSAVQDAEGDLGTRFQFARAELLEAVRNLPPDTQFNLVTFASDVRVWRRSFSAPTEANQSALRVRLKRARVLGGTNIHGALDAALSLRANKFGTRYESPVDEVFLLSDGEPSVGEVVEPESILAIVREWNRHRGVRINTVYIGDDLEGSFMRRLAEENGGKFVQL